MKQQREKSIDEKSVCVRRQKKGRVAELRSIDGAGRKQRRGNLESNAKARGEAT